MSALHVCIPNTKRDHFDYLAPEGAIPAVGTRVWVPFGKNLRVGVIIGSGAPEHRHIKLKPITSIIDTDPLIPNNLLSLCHWMSRYYHAPLSDVLTLALPKKYREGQETVALDPPELNTESAEIPLELNPEQASALHIMIAALNHYQAFVLDGVTGSGKTEVYLQLAARVLENKQQVLILVPEIGLTPQLLARFQARFQIPMATLHSHITDKARVEAWELARTGQIKLIIGTRTALFTPMPQLGLIIIDEEHDGSFKQQEGIRYSARDAALVRAHHANIPIVLGSATPSLESLHNCTLKKYTRLCLTQKAENQTPLHYQLIDLRGQKSTDGLTETTLKTIDKHIKAGNQALIFINRRGFSPVLLCHDCGWMADCPACDSHFTLHRKKNQLICHHCGLKKPISKQCETCHSEDLVPVGAGTQRVHEYLTDCFPNTNIARIDRDEVRQNKQLLATLAKIESGESQILIGTQMLAKGHHFPNLTLVVILDADAGFYNQDFRALERLGQLITQVAGRAGRAEQPGEVLIQTHFPDNPLLNQLIQTGYAAFTKALFPLRDKAAWPPYHHLALLRAYARNETNLKQFLASIKTDLHQLDVTILGPAPAPLARKSNQYHMQLLIKSASRAALHQALALVKTTYPPHIRQGGVRWAMDVDPVDLA
ncbi:MAG: primosomal protein N' [Gammaproteobacteria bacterium]|nr:primosomal protein N' [Gammaproteobacteria bacterium]